MDDPSGKLRIRVRPGPTVSIVSTRPVNAARVFVGKTVARTITHLPRLFSVCATAQAAACTSACERAGGLAPAAEVVALRRLLVAAETAKEHLWRILLDWPRFLDQAPDAPAMREVMAAYLGLRDALGRRADPFALGARGAAPDLATAEAALGTLAGIAQRSILALPPAEWLSAGGDPRAWSAAADTTAARLLRQIDARGWGSLGRCPIAPLPDLPDAALATRLDAADADAFVAAPTWHGAPAETSPFGRVAAHPLLAGPVAVHGNGLATRLAAQLVELAGVLVELAEGLATARPIDAPAPDAAGSQHASGAGIAQVAAARGLLVHRVRVQDGRVTGYRILAPTEWSFHPRGVVAVGLAEVAGIRDAHERQRLAELLVTAVDPCVDHRLVLDEPGPASDPGP